MPTPLSMIESVGDEGEVDEELRLRVELALVGQALESDLDKHMEEVRQVGQPDDLREACDHGPELPCPFSVVEVDDVR